MGVRVMCCPLLWTLEGVASYGFVHFCGHLRKLCITVLSTFVDTCGSCVLWFCPLLWTLAHDCVLWFCPLLWTPLILCRCARGGGVVWRKSILSGLGKQGNDGLEKAVGLCGAWRKEGNAVA